MREEASSLTCNEAFYFKKQNNVLIGMIILLIGGTNDIVENTTIMFKDNLIVSKVEDESIRLIGVDLKMDADKLEHSIQQYVNTLEEVPVRDILTL